MATDKNILKNWFRNGLKPPQEQFWAWMESFWHKDEKIPITAIEEIEEILNSKAEKEAFDNHLTDLNAHSNLLEISRIIPYGQVLTFKTNPDGNQEVKEPGDFCIGYVNGVFVTGVYVTEDDYDNKTELEL